MRTWFLASTLIVGALAAALPAAAANLPAGFRVRHQHALDGCDGFLIFTEKVISFESSEAPTHSAQWRLVEVATLESPNRRTVEVESITGERAEFTLVRGDLSEELYREILERIKETKTPSE